MVPLLGKTFEVEDSPGMVWYDSVIPGQFLCFCCKVLDVLEAEGHPIRAHVQRLDRLVDEAAKPKLIITRSLRNSLQINIVV